MIQSQTTLDLVIRGGMVVDGTGAPPRRADVAVRGDRIAAVGDLGPCPDVPSLDASGLAVAPGFIDSHTHDDRAVFTRADSEPKLSQGVTTVVVGNCGISLAPLDLAGAAGGPAAVPLELPAPRPGEARARSLALQGGPPPPLNLLGPRDQFRFPTFQAYVDALRAGPLPVNVAALVGHGTLRVRRLDDYALPAAPGDVRAMARDVAEAMDAGAAGLSSGLEYPTNSAAGPDEVVALASAAARAGGRLCLHIRDEFDGVAGAVREALDCARRSGAFLVLSHQKVAGAANRGRSAELLEIYRSDGADLPFAIDAYPYTAGSTVLDAARVSYSREVLVSWSRPHPELSGWPLERIRALWGCSVKEAVARLLPAGAVYFHMDPEDVDRFLAWERCMVGSDGLPHDQHPHPRLWGAFARILGDCARDRGLFTLQEAVRRMTALPAQVFGLVDRGALRKGAYADLVLFDPERVRDRATYAEPRRPAEGIHRVFVNGRQAWPGPGGEGGRWGRFLPGCGRG